MSAMCIYLKQKKKDKKRSLGEMNYIIPFIILITIVVFIHEYGHYYGKDERRMRVEQYRYEHRSTCQGYEVAA